MLRFKVGNLAGALGLEPRTSVLETEILPLNYAPKESKLFLAFFMYGMRTTPFAKLFKCNDALDFFLILGSEVVKPLTLSTL